jgi:alkylated DNA repair dioxygenase AlkB
VYNNFCLINHYRDGKDSIAPHSDGELHSKNKSVFTIAVGETRQMKLVPYSSTNSTIVFDFEAGDLLWMCGNVQSKWKHNMFIQVLFIHAIPSLYVVHCYPKSAKGKKLKQRQKL